MVSYYCSSSCCFSLTSDCRSHHKRSKRKFFRDKQWWSFLKRSDGHGGFCSSSKIKETLRAVHIRNQDSTISVGRIRKPNCSSTTKSTENVDFSMESYVIGIQATAQKSLWKLKNVVKLQAVIRGHLVRRQAVESLRCVQAIAKLQAILRAHHAPMSVELIEEQHVEMHRRSDQSEETMGSQSPVRESKSNNLHRMKFLNNSFANQLLELRPKRIPIYMKCDLSIPDSAWKWLERWSSLRPSDFLHPQNPKCDSQNEPQVEAAEQTASKVGIALADYMPNSTDWKSSIRKHDSDDWDFEFCQPMISFSVNNDDQEPRLVSVVSSNAQENSLKVETNQQEEVQDSYDETAPYSIIGWNNKSVFACMNAQSNEAVSSTTTFCSPISYLQENAEQQLRLNSILSTAESLMRSMEAGPTENMIFSDPIIELGGSESGTELSISSTLDSPDRPEVGIVYFGKEASVAKLINRRSSGSMDDTFNLENLDIDYVEAGSLQVVNRRSVDSIVAMKCSPVAQVQRDAHRLSVEEYFKRNIPESELHSIPSRKMPSKGSCNQLHRSEIAQNSKRQNVRKQSSPKANHGLSTGRESTERLRKDQNNGNRRISFGSEKADNNADQEQRGRSSAQSLPSYMQATESARAKVHTNNSARPSTDGQTNVDYAKKPSLILGANVKQGSPCKQRSVLPFSEEGTKGHHGGSHREKWQR